MAKNVFEKYSKEDIKRLWLVAEQDCECFIDQVRYCRVKENLSQENIAEILDCDRKKVLNFEMKRPSRLSIKEAFVLARLFHITLPTAVVINFPEDLETIQQALALKITLEQK